MSLTFTKHARQRMKERGITMADVVRVLAFGAPRPSRGNPVWTVDPKSLPDQNWSTLLARLCVVCTPDFRVVTVYHQQGASA